MADRELEALQSAGLKSEKMEQRKELEAVFYLLGALHYLREKDYAQVDRYLSMALRASPTHPFTIYLTGERLAADGKTEAAAESMEKLASTLPAGPEKALYESLTKRAREIRDSKGTPPKFLDDPAVVWALIRLGLQDLAKRVPETKPVIDKLEAAQQLADEMKGKLGM
jgi:tetratricopeptide (TPR) repeat protein